MLGGDKVSETQVAVPGNTAETSKNYSSQEYGVIFEYPSTYILLENEAGTPENQQKALVMVEDNQRNRDILAGKVPEVGEGPTSITVDMYQNPKNLAPEDWVKENTNWIMSDKKKETVSVGGKSGFTYFWDGLYAGKSAVVVNGTHAYVFSVTWITADDQMVKDFEKILASVKFSN